LFSSSFANMTVMVQSSVRFHLRLFSFFSIVAGAPLTYQHGF
jgi:hypothetical protein